MSGRSQEHSEDGLERSGVAVRPVCRPGVGIGVTVGGGLVV